MKIPNSLFFHKEKWKSTTVQNETKYNKRLAIWKNDMYNHTMWVVVTK
jgi:hypothetical protein